MKIKRKMFLSILILILTLFLNTDVFAATKYYYSVGTNYGSIGGDSTPEATWVSGTFGLKRDYMGSLNTRPTYDNLNATYVGRKVLESDVLYFLGHASSSSILWNYNASYGSYATGIGNAANDYYNGSYHIRGIGAYALSKVQLAIFQGCSTAANSDSNLPKYAVSKGAKTAIGWATDINQSDSLPWIKRFFSSDRFPNTISNMVTYANSYNYTSTDIKNTRVYGNTTQSTFSSGTGTAIMSNPSNLLLTNIDNRKTSVNKEVENLNNLNSEKVKDIISDIIIKSVNQDFDSSNYTMEIANNDYGNIYDLYFMINGVKTNLGYTIFTNQEKTMITDIYNNMNHNDENKVIANKADEIKNKLSVFTSEKSIQFKSKALVDAKNKNIDATIEVVNDFAYYHVGEEQLYHITTVKITLQNGASSIIDYRNKI